MISPRPRTSDQCEDIAVTYHVRAEVADRTFEQTTIDVGFGDRPNLAADQLRGTDLLTFAEMQPIPVWTFPLGRHVSEKLHSYTRIYDSGHRSTRPKDLIDLVLIANLSSLNSSELLADIDAVFRIRAMHAAPLALPPPPESWRVAYAQLAAEIELDPDLAAGYAAVAAFLDPILDRSAVGRVWNPTRHAWQS